MEDTMMSVASYNYGKDHEAMNIVTKYVFEHLDKSDKVPEFSVFIVWKAKVLQNWKYLISTTLFDGMYYELTYNGDAAEWYLDAYKKFENKVIPTEDSEWMKERGVKPQ